MNAFFRKKPQDDPITTKELQQTADEIFSQGVVSLHDFIAPSSVEFFSGHAELGIYLMRTCYVFGYPREIETGWLSELISLSEIMDISFTIYPVETEIILKNLRKKVGQLEAGIRLDQEKGKVRDPAKESQIVDAEEMRDRLQVGQERFFRFGFYYTVYGKDVDHLEDVDNKIDTILRQRLVYSKKATTQQEEGFNSVLPQLTDRLLIRRNMNTGALGTTFPFTSSDLTQDRGVLYGINLHNSGLVIFDRFSLPNPNSVIFSVSGAGKSFLAKLEIMRLMMTGVKVIVIDPENEYQKLAEAVGGTHINLSLNSQSRINPFDLSAVESSQGSEDNLRNNIINLLGLMRIMMASPGSNKTDLSSAEEADLDEALITTYAKAGITSDPLTHNSPAPTMTDFYDTLLHMGKYGPGLADKIRKYTTGTFAGIFSQQTNLRIDNQLVIFSVRDLEDELRPIAMYIVLNHIWNQVRADTTKKALFVDEAWQIMQHNDSANFLFGLVKRSRKYNIGITNITQDVEDFTSSQIGRAIIANSSLHILLKQSVSSVDMLADIFKLTEVEKKRLSQFPIGQCLFFAGSHHVQIQIVASPTEHSLASSNPDQLEALKEN